MVVGGAGCHDGVGPKGRKLFAEAEERLRFLRVQHDPGPVTLRKQRGESLPAWSLAERAHLETGDLGRRRAVCVAQRNPCTEECALIGGELNPMPRPVRAQGSQER